jgi:hypothetical protein
MLAAPAALLLSDTCPPGNLLPPNATVTALLLRLSDSDGKPLDDSWKAVGCAAVLGFNHVNSRNGAVVPSLASLPKDAPLLSYYPFDTLSTAAGGTAAYRAARAVAASNLVGPARSAVATPLATTASIDQLPMNSYWASSPELSAPVFSFFNRVWPSDTVPVQPLCLWMASLGWKHFGLLYVNDAYGRAYLDALIQVCPSSGVALQRTAFFQHGDPVSARVAVHGGHFRPYVGSATLCSRRRPPFAHTHTHYRCRRLPTTAARAWPRGPTSSS